MSPAAARTSFWAPQLTMALAQVLLLTPFKEASTVARVVVRLAPVNFCNASTASDSSIVSPVRLTFSAAVLEKITICSSWFLIARFPFLRRHRDNRDPSLQRFHELINRFELIGVKVGAAGLHCIKE